VCVAWVRTRGSGVGPESERQDGEGAGRGEEGEVYCLACKLGWWGSREVVLVGEIEGLGSGYESARSRAFMTPLVIAIEEGEGEEC